MTVGTGLKVFLLASLLVAFALAVAWAGPVDTDGDGITDDVDNCTTRANSPQTDSDNDGCGNVCDPDYWDATQTPPGNGIVDIIDFFKFQDCFVGTYDVVCDHTPDPPNGIADINDFFVFQEFFAFGLPPGPGANCAGP